MIRITESMRSKILETILKNPKSATELIPLPNDGRHYVSQVEHENKDFIYLFAVPVGGKKYFLYSKKIGT
jgi:hypothetical protein